MNRQFDINSPGYSIKCRLYCEDRRNIRHMVLYGHGFGGHKDNKAAERFAERVLSKFHDVAVMTFDLPCHGDDVRQKMKLEDCDTYIGIVIDHIRETYDDPLLYCYATSFGGYLFLKYIHEHGNPFRKIALRCPAVNMYEVLTNTITTGDDLLKLKKGKVVPVGFDRKIRITQDFLSELYEADISKCDFVPYAEEILILHGTKDEVIPIETVSEFADENIIEFLPVEHADHRFSDLETMRLAIKEIVNWFEFQED